MSLPMIGTWPVRVESARPFSIHGDLYVELVIAHVETGERAIVRVPQHAITGDAPMPGERFELTFLMGQVTAAKRMV